MNPAMIDLYYNNWKRHGLEVTPKPAEVRNLAASVGLAPMEDYLIDPKVHKLYMGLGWDRNVDVDASAALFDASFLPMDQVWWHNLKSKTGGVKHSGDDRTGDGEGDDEIIKIDLEDLSLQTHYILLAVCIYSEGFTFQQVQRAYVRMLNGKPSLNQPVLCSFSLSELHGNAMLMGLLTRKGAYWNFRALGIPSSGRTILDIIRQPVSIQCLQECPSFFPERRRIAVKVVEGKNLAAKDSGGMFSRVATSDPYYVIRFKKRRFESPYVAKNLNPRWPPAVFVLGELIESEQKALKVEIFDYDAMSSPDFMGCIWIPGSALYNKGIGTHPLWFSLGPSKNPEYIHSHVSGEILLEIEITQTIQPTVPE